MAYKGTPLQTGRMISRAVNLTFKITNAKEQFAEVQAITRAITHALMMLRILRLAQKATMAGFGPLGWAMLGITSVTEAYMLGMEFTAKEEYNARSPS